MSETSEMWAEHKATRRAKKEQNRIYSTALLDGVPNLSYKSNNGGIHLIISYGHLICDLWPTTGKWRIRKLDKHGRGVTHMLKALKTETGQNQPS